MVLQSLKLEYRLRLESYDKHLYSCLLKKAKNMGCACIRHDGSSLPKKDELQVLLPVLTRMERVLRAYLGWDLVLWRLAL